MSREMAKATAPRRIFKPTIPTTRRATQRSSNGVIGGVNGIGGGSRDGSGWDSSSSDQNNCCNGGKVKGKQKINKPRGKKEFIQLDATFNGINKIPVPIKVERASIGPGVSGFGHSNDTRSSQNDSPRDYGSTGLMNGGSSSLKIKNDDDPSYGDKYKTSQMVNHHQGAEVIKGEEGTEENIEHIQRTLYRDNFVSLFDPNEEGMTPIGWECVSQHQVFKQEKKRDVKSSASSSIRFDKWASTSNDQDKMVLFQLPEMLLNSGDGHVGKIRMYQSGKMELIDTRTGLVHDLVHTDRQVNSHPQCEDDDEADDADDETDDNNSDEDNNSEDNNQSKESTLNGESNFSTDWIKKEDEDDIMHHNRNYDSLPPPTFSKPSTSSSYSSSSMQSPSSSKLKSSKKSSTSTTKSSKSKTSSKNPKANSKTTNNHKLNRSTHCDKDEEIDDDDDDDDMTTYREACTFDGEHVVCLGPISNNQLLIGRPRLDKFINL